MISHRRIRRLAVRAGLDGPCELGPHSLRDAFITGAREVDIPLEEVQDAAAGGRRTTRHQSAAATP